MGLISARTLGFAASFSLALVVQARQLFAAEVWGTERLVSVNRATAASVNVGNLGSTGPFGMAYVATANSAYLVDQGSTTGGLFSVSLATGAAVHIGAANTFGSAIPRGLAWRAATSTMYTADINGARLLSVNLTTGVPTLVTSLPGSGTLAAITYDNTTDTLYGLTFSSGWRLTRIDPATGISQSALFIASGGEFRSLAYDTQLNLFWTHNTVTGQLTSINLATGVITPVGSTLQPGASGTVFNALVFVPSPGPGMCMVLMGGALLRRRRPTMI